MSADRPAAGHQRLRRALAVLGLALLVTCPAAHGAGNVDLPRHPSISPDGSSILFSWRGDLWMVGADGGQARRLTSHPADEHASAWSPDGERIAFESNRDGATGIYLMNTDGTDIEPVSDFDLSLQLAGFGDDGEGGQAITLHANIEGDVYRSHRPYMISLEGGGLARLHDAFGSHPRVSPDGTKVVFVRGGYYYGTERRHGRGPETMDVWLYDREGDSFTQLTEWAGHDAFPRWEDDRTVVFLSDRERDCMNLYRLRLGDDDDEARRLTGFREHDVTDFDVSADGSTAVLRMWDALYTLDLVRNGARPVELTITANEDWDDDNELRSIDRDVSEAALSPDGKVMAMVAYGEVYVRALEEDAPTRRVTHTHARERDIAWSPDGLKLYFASDRDGTESIYAATVALTRGEIKERFEEITDPDLDADDDEGDDAADDGDDEADEDDDRPAPRDASGESIGGDGRVDVDRRAVTDRLAAEASAPSSDPEGTWAGSVDVPNMGAMTFVLELALDGDDLTGTMDAQGASMPVSGSWDDSSSSFDIAFATPDDDEVSMRGTIDGDTMSGDADYLGMNLTFSATREGAAPEKADEPSGAAKSPAAGDDEAKKEAKDVPREFDPKRWADAMKFEIEPVVQEATNDRDPKPSPDGTYLSFRRTRGDIVLLDLETGDERVVLESWDFGNDWRFSPDGRWVAWENSDLDFNSDIWIVPTDGSADPVNVTRHPDNDSSPRWSADGRVMAYVSERVNEEYDVYLVMLDKDLEALPSNELEDYFENAAKAAKKRTPLAVEVPDDEDDGNNGEADDDDEADDERDEAEFELELDDAYLRPRRLTSLPGNEGNLELAPGGDRLVFTGNYGGFGLWSVDWKGDDRKRLGGAVDVQHLSLDGSKVVYVSGGRAGHVGIGGGSQETVAISDRIRIDLQEQASQKFLEMARTLGEQFYHPDMKGVDWEELTKTYHELATQTRTPSEFNEVANRFLGELCASHLGVRSTGGFSSDVSESIGRLGINAKRVELDGDRHGFEVTEILPEGPSSGGPMALEIGDVITAIELEPFTGRETISSRLEGRVDQETIVSVRRSIDGDDVELDLLITPGSYWQMRQLSYEHWRRENARMVEEWSDGRLGYIHIQGMNQPSLDVFERDLFAACEGKDGLIVDVRNNGGGWTTDRLLSSIMVRPHAYTIPRGADPDDTGHYPQDRLFIARYTLPMNALCNEKSFSNAEIFSHAFKNLGRGTLVGQETWGGVISTGGFGLIDGTSVRLPFRGWYVPDGTDMENAGAVPDIIVPQTPEAEAAGEDEQLEAAVEDLLERLDD